MRSQSLVIVLCLLLAACGFHPLYGDKTGQATTAMLDRIEIATLPERSGQYLRQELIDRMQPHGLQKPAQYKLAIAITEAKGDQTIAKDATVTRSFIRHIASYKLISSRTDKVLLERSLNASNSYNNLFSEFGTLITEEDARSRNLDELAERITQQLSVYLAHPMKQAVPAAPKNPQEIKSGRTDIKSPTANLSNWQ